MRVFAELPELLRPLGGLVHGPRRGRARPFELVQLGHLSLDFQRSLLHVFAELPALLLPLGGLVHGPSRPGDYAHEEEAHEADHRSFRNGWRALHVVNRGGGGGDLAEHGQGGGRGDEDLRGRRCVERSRQPRLVDALKKKTVTSARAVFRGRQTAFFVKQLIYSAARTVASLSMAVGRVALSCPHQSSWLCCWALAISFAVWSTKWWNHTKAAPRPTTMGPYGCDLPVAGSTGRRPNVPIASAATTPITTACGGGGRLALGRRRASVGSRARAGRARARARRFLLVFLRSVSVALVVSRGAAARGAIGLGVE